MLKIIKLGKGLSRNEKAKTYREKTHYIKKCYNCKTKFTYQFEDIRVYVEGDEYVTCPKCNDSNYIFFRRKYRKGNK